MVKIYQHVGEKSSRILMAGIFLFQFCSQVIAFVSHYSTVSETGRNLRAMFLATLFTQLHSPLQQDRVPFSVLQESLVLFFLLSLVGPLK